MTTKAAVNTGGQPRPLARLRARGDLVEFPFRLRVAASADTRSRSEKVSTPIQTVFGTATTASLKRLARIAGVFYLFVASSAAFEVLTFLAGPAASERLESVSEGKEGRA